MTTIIILSIIFFLIDLISKIIIKESLFLGQSIKVINNFFNITYVRNTGAAFSILSKHTYLLVFVSIFIITLVLYYINKNKPKTKIEYISYSMILGGAVGNLYDRIVYGYVIDFLDFLIFGYEYPIFNLSDSFIFIGVLILIVYMWRCKDGNKSSWKWRFEIR